jgi:hypothetical protein
VPQGLRHLRMVRNVIRGYWRVGRCAQMILRWTAAGVVEVERNFRRVARYRALTKLDAVLRAHDAAIDRGFDNRKQAA